MNENVFKSLEVFRRIAAKHPRYNGDVETLTAALSAPASDSAAIEHRDLAMALAAALVEHVRNYFDGGEQDHAKLNEFQKAAQHEINRLYSEVFNRRPFDATSN